MPWMFGKAESSKSIKQHVIVLLIKNMTSMSIIKLEECEMVLCSWSSYLIRAGCLVDSACVFIVLLGLGLVCHPVGLVYGCHVVHQGNGLHGLMNSTTNGLADLSGCWSSGGWKVMGGLKTITEGTVIKQSYNTLFWKKSFTVVKTINCTEHSIWTL